MKKQRLLVLTTSEGHRSIAEALSAFLKEHQFDISFCFIEERGLVGYRVFYRMFPQLFSWVFSLSKNGLVDALLQKLLSIEHFHTLKHQIEKEKPSVVLNTSFGFTPALVQLKKTHHFTFINVMPNPRSFFKQDVAIGADCVCVFDEQTEKDIKTYPNHPQTLQTGWFVRPQFRPTSDKSAVRKMIQLQDNKLTFLLVAGSEGTQAVFQQVLTLSSIDSIQCVVACGNNAKLFQKVTQLSKSANAHLTALPFTKELHLYMQSADLVIGKAGPNMIFESVACGVPFFVTTHVGGLEDGNLQLIKEYDIGFVEEDPQKAQLLLKELIASPEKIQAKQAEVEKLSAYLDSQKQTLLRYLDRELLEFLE